MPENEDPGADAVEAALRLLRHRDRSTAGLELKLAERGFGEAERAEAIATLERTRVLDDRRYAESRAVSLAERGAGDALVRHDLESAGIASELVEEALSLLEPEPDRALRVVERRGGGVRTLRYLASKGFSEDAIALAAHGSGGAVARESDGALG
jgi:SOS response regulatory protein OraA/RecX